MNMRRRSNFWIGLFLVLGVALAAQAQDLQIRGRIAFTSTRDNPNDQHGWEVYSMSADGTGVTRLTSNGIQDYSDPGAWSPDGTKIVFQTNRDGNFEIYTMNANGTSQTRLTNVGASEGRPCWSPDGTKIAYWSNRNDSGDIYVINADGTGDTRLTTTSSVDYMPSWSPDGSKIAFETNRDGNYEIYAMNADGTGATRLTNNSADDHNASWSPDGTQIVFDSNRDGNNEIYVMNADGSSQTRVTNASTFEGVPVWSPDGTKILFVTNRDGNTEIYSMNADGSSQTRLTNEGQPDSNNDWEHFRLLGSTSGATISRIVAIDNKGSATLTVSNITSSDGQFSVAPTNFSVAAGSSQNVTVSFTPTSTGTKYSTLTITSNDLTSTTAKLTVNATATGVLVADLEIRGKIAFYTSRDGNNEIYLMNADGTSPSNLTNNGFDEQWGRWSPDGTKVLFRSNRNAPGGNGNDLFVVNTDGSGLTNLTSGATGDDDRASWSPDGSKIVFDYGSGTAQIYTMNADGSGRTQLTSASGLSSTPNWSPDGSKIVFASNRSGNADIWVMNADGSDQQNLTSGSSAPDNEPSWSPDGSQIVFATTRDGNSEIYVMNADGTGQANRSNSGAGDYEPWWSPDGTKIVYNSAGEVYTMDASNGGNKTNITNNGAADGGPTWDTPYRIGTAAMGTSVPRTITIDNKGTGTLTVSNITSSDGQFVPGPTGFSVPAGSSQNVTVTFTPTSVGVKYSTLTITSNDATSPTAKLTVNGTGQGIAASVPDTVASYNQLVSVPVRVGDTSGEGVVAGEAHLVFNGDVLSVFSVGTSSTLLSGWTVQSNVVQGNATVMDTLKIATAHTTALSGAGTLFKVRFQVADLRHPVTSPLVLSHLLFNTGSVGTSVTNGSLKLVGSNGSISSVPPVTIPRHAIGVTVSEVDENRNSGVAEVRSVRVSNGSQSETLSVTETGLSTGVFTGSIGTVFSLGSSSGDGVVQAKAGDEIVFAFDDSLDGAGNTVVRRDTTQVIGGKDGRVRVTVVSQPGDTVRVKLTDGDLNTNPGLAENTTLTGVNGRTGESEVLTLTEKSVNDSIFFGTVKTSLGSTAGPNNDGVFKAQKGDTLRVSYADTLTLQGGYATVIDRDKVVNPFGDADGNGSVQAFDAARVLFHVLAPFIVGIDSLSANVDLLAPFGQISPFDASLILQKRVGLIGRFPVQEDESDNHPQPETDLSTPKPVVAQRVLSLAQGEGYWSVLADERGGILSGEVVLSGIEGRVALAPELQEYLVASRNTEGGVRAVFAGAVPVSGPGELLRVYPGVGPGRAQLTRAELNDGTLGVVLSGGASAVEVPTSFALLGNWPNPFNPETTIGFALPERSVVTLAVYDVLGQRVRVLVGRALPAGQHQVVWDGRDELGRQVSSGVYMYHLQAGPFSQLKRMVMVK